MSLHGSVLAACERIVPAVIGQTVTVEQPSTRDAMIQALSDALYRAQSVDEVAALEAMYGEWAERLGVGIAELRDRLNSITADVPDMAGRPPRYDFTTDPPTVLWGP